MAYDAARNRVVLHGGTTASGVAADTWEWDGESWKQLPTTGLGPRTSHAMAYDPLRQQLVLFGGHDGAEKQAGAWTLSKDAWTRLDEGAKEAPQARTGHVMAFDASRGVVVLQGGRNDGPPLGDTWEWTGTEWLDVSLTDPSQLAADQITMCPDGQGLLLAMPERSIPSQVLEFWTRRGTRWSRVPLAAGQRPDVRKGPALAYDPGRGLALLLGGADGWSWDGSTLTRLPTAQPQPPLHLSQELSPAAAADGTSVWLYSGGPTVDLWRWDGAGWLDQSPTSAPAVPGGGALAVYLGAPYFYEFLSLGCSPPACPDGRLWELSKGVWQLLEPTPRPSARLDPALVSTPRGLLLVGGAASAGDGVTDTDTWLYTPGKGWAVKPGLQSGRAALQHPAVAYDPKRDRVVSFGGRVANSPLRPETWEWDGTSWTIVSTQGPAPRWGAAATYDRASQKVVLVGGMDAQHHVLSDVWEWDGATWNERTALPEGRVRMALADGPTGLVTYGGNFGLGQQLIRAPALGRRPALQFEASLPPTLCHHAAISSVRVRANAAGAGGMGTPGVELYGWSTRGEWRKLASRGDLGATGMNLPAPPSAPLDWTSPGDAQELVLGQDCRLAFQLRPLVGSTPGAESALLVDFLEVRVRYTPQ